MDYINRCRSSVQRAGYDGEGAVAGSCVIKAREIQHATYEGRWHVGHAGSAGYGGAVVEADIKVAFAVFRPYGGQHGGRGYFNSLDGIQRCGLEDQCRGYNIELVFGRIGKR